jgi:chitin disaccharide deacetylase
VGPERSLIINADDLGLSQGVNAGILRAHARGIVTSASLMVRQAGVHEAVRLATEHPALALGLHVDLGQWDYVRGEWVAAYMRCEQTDETAVNVECRSQLQAFRALLGCEPTHLDSHQHIHNSEPVASVMRVLAAELGVPLRGQSIRYEGGFYGQTGKGEPAPEGITAEHLALLIGELPAGWTELGCHPGIGLVAESSYGHERQLEVQALCDPRVSAALQQAGVRLRSFADFNDTT